MIRNYIKIAWRNLVKNKSYALINVVGLSLGIACSILIFSLIHFELSYDNFHQNSDRIYRLTTEFHNEEIDHNQAVPSPLGKAFRNDFSFAEKTARCISYNGSLISIPGTKENKKFIEDRGVSFAEPAFFEILNFPIIEGNKTSPLNEPNSAILSEKIAAKYFGKENPLGKRIRFENKIDFTVKAVMKNIPGNTDIKEEIYLSYHNLKEYNKWIGSDSSWQGVYSGSLCYTRLKPGIKKADVEKSLLSTVKKYYKEDDVKEWVFKLLPLANSHTDPSNEGKNDHKNLWALGLIGCFLIITACVNFINLATAQALNRSKEVGIRKVLGSLRSQLFWQFIAETAILTAIALALAYALSQMALPYLNELFQIEMQISVIKTWQLPVFLLLLFVLVVLLAGSYPGLVLSRFQPIDALKGCLSQKHIGGFSLRRILVVVQFAISQILIIVTIVVANQMSYSKTADLGFNKDAIIVLPVPVKETMKISTFKNRLASIPGVEQISFCYQPPAANSNNNTSLSYNNRPKDELWSVNMKEADENYLKLFGLKLIAGRNLYPSDTIREYIVNENFVKKLGIRNPAEVIGKMAKLSGKTFPIVGVIKDFNNYSFRDEISPVAFYSNMIGFNNCAIKINLAKTAVLLPSFEKLWNETFPEYVYSYRFMDDRIAEFYEQDQTMLKLLQFFAGIAIFIGCLGLYGLVSFMAVRKTKEIGVRKVLGASIISILWLFGKEFGKLLLLAFVFAAPLAWWAMHKYLEDFKYRIPIGAGIFLTAFGCTLLIAIFTVGYRSAQAALSNPVKSLRTE